MKTLLYTPFTGLGMYGGFRGNRWLKNRIQIFKQFVISSLRNQTDQDFVHWIGWRPEERDNKHVVALGEWLTEQNYKFVFTFGGLCFWDDKFSDEIAREKLAEALRITLPVLFDSVPDCDEVVTLLVPSDDLYDKNTVSAIKKALEDKKLQAVGFQKGYLCNYNTKEVLEYNPKTNPPFFAIRFPREVFFDPGKHMQYISLKKDVGQYKRGTPYPSHEYLADCLAVGLFDYRGFTVGTHGENISTHFNHPYGGAKVEGEEKLEVLKNFGIQHTPILKLNISIRKILLRKLPHKWQRKLRYLVGEKVVHRLYEFLRN